jgi:uncharacterized protein YjbJ (UPF0337 family)
VNSPITPGHDGGNRFGLIEIKKISALPPKLKLLFTRSEILEEEMVDKDRIIGSAKVIKGNVKEAVGKSVGDAKLAAEGKADQIEGKVQNAVGGIKDTLRGK